MEMYLHICHNFGDSVVMWIACSCDAPHLLHHMILEAFYYTTINVLHTKILQTSVLGKGVGRRRGEQGAGPRRRTPGGLWHGAKSRGTCRCSSSQLEDVFAETPLPARPSARPRSSLGTL